MLSPGLTDSGYSGSFPLFTNSMYALKCLRFLGFDRYRVQAFIAIGEDQRICIGGICFCAPDVGINVICMQ